MQFSMRALQQTLSVSFVFVQWMRTCMRYMYLIIIIIAVIVQFSHSAVTKHTALILHTLGV